MLYATLLVLFSNYDALLVTYRNGDLTSTIAVFAGACVGWLGLRRVRFTVTPPGLGCSSVVRAPLVLWA
ncbi:hypothetical protein [Streptomyces sp. NPDC055400]